MHEEANKVLYGTLEASILFWKNISKKLRRNGLSDKRIRLMSNEQDY